MLKSEYVTLIGGNIGNVQKEVEKWLDIKLLIRTTLFAVMFVCHTPGDVSVLF